MRTIALILFIMISKIFAVDIFIDSKNGLVWEDSYESKTTTRNFNDAQKYCDKLNIGGFDDWRLPTRLELLTIIDDTKYNPMSSKLKNIAAYSYLSSSVAVGTNDYIWYVDFLDGKVRNYAKDSTYYVRCVRSQNKIEATSDISELYSISLENIMNSISQPIIQTKIEKEMFEKQKEFDARVEKIKQENAIAIDNYKKEFQRFFPIAKASAMKNALESFYGKPYGLNLAYDADNEIMVMDVNFEKNKNFITKVAINISPKDAKKFYSDFQKSITPVALFDFDGSTVNLQSIRFDYLQKDFTIKQYASVMHNKDLSSNQRIVTLDNNYIETRNFDAKIEVGNNFKTSFDASNLITTNDLDLLIEKSPQFKQNPKKWAFIVGVENYKYTDNVIYAKRSAEMFAKVANKTLGVPPQNTFVLLNENATAAEIKNKLKLFIRNINKDDEIYFYYNGHGIPAADKENEPFILSADMMPDFVSEESFFMLKQIYNELSSSKASSIIAIIDSCFTGTTDGKSIQKGVAATKIKPKSVDFDKTKMVVMTAGKDNQYSNAYNQKAHRLFSFFVMQELISGEKNIKQLYEKVYRQTKDTTIKNYGLTRLQEPQIDGNDKLGL